MFKTRLGRSARRTAASIGLLILLAAAAGAGRAEEDPYTFCQRKLIAGVVRSVAIAVITPADFNYYFYSALIGYEWCRKLLE